MEKEKKGIRCSYAVLVIILFAALAFVVDYAVIDRKVNKCSCPDCSASGNTNVVEDDAAVTEKSGEEITADQNENTGVTNNTNKTYNDLAGHYKATFIDENDTEYPEKKLELYLYSDATYYYTYTSRFFAGSVGTYTIDNGKIIMNSLFTHGSDIGTGVGFSTNTASVSDNNEIIINYLPTSSIMEKNITFSRVEKYNESNNENSLVKQRLNETQLYNEYMKNN